MNTNNTNNHNNNTRYIYSFALHPSSYHPTGHAYLPKDLLDDMNKYYNNYKCKLCDNK